LIGLDPLIVLSPDDKKEIMRVTADGNGNYRATTRCPKPQASACPLHTATVHNTGKSNRPCGYGHRYGCSLISELAASHPHGWRPRTPELRL